LWSIPWQLLNPEIYLKEAILGLLTGGGLFYLIAVLSKGGMGGGDIKLMAVLGFAAGWPLVFVVFFLAFFFGAFAGLILLFVQKKSWQHPLPFGPFLSLSFFISIFWGLPIWQWYLLYV
jgi:leader peptidase (prepilin peptidase)/N-methyltransferase